MQELLWIQITSSDLGQMQAQLQEAITKKEKEHQELVSIQNLLVEESTAKDKDLQDH